MRQFIGLLILAHLLSGLVGGWAQAPASSSQATSTAPADSDSVRVEIPDYIRVNESLPTLTSAGSVAGLLDRQRGSFLYDLGQPGWPHGWSRFGLAPRKGGLTLDGVPFTDLFSGRPLFDYLPRDLLQPLEVGSAQYGRSHTVAAELRAYPVERPLTELRYRTGSAGSQSVSVLHTQRLPMSFLPADSTLNVLFNYVGGATDGTYTNSDTWTRMLTGRIGYGGRKWDLSLRHLYQKRRRGAQGGVVLGRGPGTVFQPSLAHVHLAQSRVVGIRHDALARLGVQWSDRLPPAEARFSWVMQRSRFDQGGAITELDGSRYHLQLFQRLPLADHTVSARADVWQDRIEIRNAARDSVYAPRHEVHLQVKDSVRWGGVGVVAAAELSETGQRVFPGGYLRLHRNLGAASLFAEGGLSGADLSFLAQHGLPLGLTTDPSLAPERHSWLRGGVDVQLSDWRIAATGIARRTDSPVLLFEGEQPGSAGYLNAPEAHYWLQGDLKVSWGRERRSGPWLKIHPRSYYLLRPRTPIAISASGSLPRVFTDGAVGWHLLLFEERLDVDLRLHAKMWTRMRSRTLQPFTGLFPLRSAGTPIWGPSGTVGGGIKAGIRAATLFLSYDHLLAGISYPGTLMTPVYPLPQRFLQFGVHWPLFN